MTEQEARRILNEHRSECPSFYRWKQFYQVRKDGRTVDVYRATKTRAVFSHTTTADDISLHPDVRARLR